MASLRKRLFQITAVVVTLAIIALYFGMPTVMAFTAIAPDGSAVGAAPDHFSEIMLTTSDGYRLGAWYAEPQNGAAIILVHGAGGGRDNVRSYAEMLRDNGFGVLALNLRGYGDSEGQISRLGWKGTLDIGAAVTYLTALENVESIGGLGLSLGGEVLLGAASAYPMMQAIVTEGATFRALNEYTALPMNQPLYRCFTQGVFSFMVGVFSGDQQPQPTISESIQTAESTSFLFIAAGNDDDESAYNTLFHDTAPDRSEVWVIQDVGHTGGFSHDPQAYEQRVTGFFANALAAQS